MMIQLMASRLLRNFLRGVKYDQDGADDGGGQSAKIALEGGKVYHIKFS